MMSGKESAASPDVSLTTSSARISVTEKCEFGTNSGHRPKFEYTLDNIILILDKNVFTYLGWLGIFNSISIVFKSKTIKI